MAHFAQIEDGVVTQVIVVNNEVLLDDSGTEQESIGVAFCRGLYGQDTQWVQTSFNSTFRKNFAALGARYDSEKDAFIQIKPDWADFFNEETCRWELTSGHATD